MHRIDRTWDGAPVDDVAAFALARDADHLIVAWVAPLHDDPRPAAPPGLLDGLWQHEVVEVFLAGPDGHYLELEVGPHGHVLGLSFDSVRHRAGPPWAAEVATRRRDGWWVGRARVPAARLPALPWRGHAARIHGTPRRYLTSADLSGPTPDFHQPHRWPAWAPAPRIDPAALVAATPAGSASSSLVVALSELLGDGGPRRPAGPPHDRL